MNDFTKGFIERTSIGLPYGGDTHIDPWGNGRGFSVTTRLPGGLDFHDDFRFHDMFGQRTPPRPDVLGQMPW
jgi:hypothetical protein